jgi:hypothetical protein
MDSHDDMQARRGAVRTLMLMLPFWDVEFDLDSTGGAGLYAGPCAKLGTSS